MDNELRRREVFGQSSFFGIELVEEPPVGANTPQKIPVFALVDAGTTVEDVEKPDRGVWRLNLNQWEQVALNILELVAEERVKHRSTADFNYSTWVRQGHLRTTPGSATDQEFVLHAILDICEHYNVTKIGVDRWGMQGYFGPKLMEEGLNVGGVGQSFAHISEPLKTIERQVLNAQLCHGGHPVLRWQVSNCQLVKDASDNFRICKRSSK